MIIPPLSPQPIADFTRRGARPWLPARFASLGSLAVGVGVLVAAGTMLSGPFPRLWPLLGAPVIEEIVFRAGLHEGLLRLLSARATPLPRWWANAGCAAVFAAAHVATQPGLMALATLLPALAIGALYQQQRRVLPCILLHAAFNAGGALLITFIA